MQNHQKEYKRHAMVDWYLPSQLLKTGIKTLFSTALGASIDTRRLQAVGDTDDCIIDYSDRDDFSFDYLADTGDGWNSTYSLAYLLLSPNLSASGQTSKRSDIVIMGGDEIYPVASEDGYQERLVDPFNKAALDLRSQSGFSKLVITDLYMVPGNHDWYDSLGSFSKKFLAYKRSNGDIKQRQPFSQFRNRQLRSYYILKLPNNWEIWSLDIQLQKGVDNQQFSFFNDHAQSINENTKIIICSAEPEYVYGAEATGDLDFTIHRISRLADIKGAKVKLQLAGDVHNYQHYAIQDKNNQAYTCHHLVSGGGAFLHPTHGFKRGSDNKVKFEPVKRYPSESVSQSLTSSLLAFAFQHKGMSAFIGALYLAFFWAIGPNLADYCENMIETIFMYPVNHFESFIVLIIAFFGCFAFAAAGGAGATNKCWGFVHWLGHVLLALVAWHLGVTLTETMLPNTAIQEAEAMKILAVYLQILLTFLIGGVLGGTWFGTYLCISLNYFRIHHNETFSALACPHYKNFLRCKINADGGLNITVIGIDQTASDDAQHPVQTEIIDHFNIS